MEYRKLGKSALRISEIAFGCMSLEGSDADNARLLHQARDKGINYFDTADLYDRGRNEETVGKALRPHRSEVILATKVGNQWRPDGSGWDWNPRKEYILQAVEASLRRLQTDYIDLYQLHGGTLEDPIDETIEAFELLQEQGKIRYYGISSIRPNVIREFVSRSKLVSVMMQYSLLDRRPEETCLDLLRENQVGVLVRGAYAQGLLLGKTPKPYLDLPAGAVARVAARVQELAERKNHSLADVALDYVLGHPAVVAAVTGIRTEAQLTAALAAAHRTPLTETGRQALQALMPANVYQQHR